MGEAKRRKGLGLQERGEFRRSSSVITLSESMSSESEEYQRYKVSGIIDQGIVYLFRVSDGKRWYGGIGYPSVCEGKEILVGLVVLDVGTGGGAATVSWHRREERGIRRLVAEKFRADLEAGVVSVE